MSRSEYQTLTLPLQYPLPPSALPLSPPFLSSPTSSLADIRMYSKGFAFAAPSYQANSL